MVDGFTKEVVGANSAGNVFSGTVITFWLVTLFCEFDGNFELRKNVTFDIQSNFRRVGRRRDIAHESAEMVGAEVDLVSQRKLGGSDAKFVGCSGFLEDLVAAGVFEFEGKLAVSFGLVIGSIECESTNVDGLTWLVDGLFGREEDGCLVFKLDSLRELGRSDRCLRDIANLALAREARGKAKLSFDSAVAVQAAGEEQARLLVRDNEFDADSAGLGNIVVVGVGDDNADGSLATGEILGLAEDVDHRPAEDL